MPHARFEMALQPLILPYDVCYEIATLVGGDQDVRALSLVGHNWVKACQSQLFKKLNVSLSMAKSPADYINYEGSPWVTLKKFQTTFPRPCGCMVKHVRILFTTPFQLARAEDIMATCTAVHALELLMNGPDKKHQQSVVCYPTTSWRFGLINV